MLIIINLVESPTKVPRSKGKKQEKEETESAAEPEGESGNDDCTWNTETCNVKFFITAFEPPEEYEDQG